MTCDILIRTYRKDADWLEMCLESIVRKTRGFRAVLVVTPRDSAAWIRRVTRAHRNVRLEVTHNYRDDYLGQQATKLAADCFSDAQFICHVDADCIFCRPTAPEDLVCGGRARMIIRPATLLDRHWPWRTPTEAFLGWPVTHDFMRRPPFTFPRWLYGDLRAYSDRAHAMPLSTYVTTRPPRGFSEFNARGAFAWAKHRDRFVWVDDSAADPGEPHCRWYWSWGGVDSVIRREVRGYLEA